jgi:hypothetical protein
MNTTVRTFLIELARKRTNQIVTYQRLSDLCYIKLEMSNPDHRNQMAKILEEVSIVEHKSIPARPLLSALVLRLNDGFEGDGFYKLGEGIGYGDWKKLKREGTFEILEIAKCIEFWSNESNYRKFK